MTQKEINGNFSVRFPRKIRSLFLSILIGVLFTNPAFSQNDSDTAAAVLPSNGDNTFAQMLDYSRPGRFHQLLASLPGTWTYKGGHPDSSGKVASAYYGTFVWKPFANGRFFIGNVTSSKIKMPIQDGKTKETDYKAIYTLGYNNVKKKFEQTTINNMIGSDISFFEGNYDSTINAIIFDYMDQPIPGMNLPSRLVFRFIDPNHYLLEYFDEQNGKYVKNNEVYCTRSMEK